MSRTPKNVSDEDAREITEYLLNKGIPQTQIASTVKRSQSWWLVSNANEILHVTQKRRDAKNYKPKLLKM